MIFRKKYELSPEQESQFQKKYNENQLVSVRVGLLISIIAYAFFSISDELVAPSSNTTLLNYRFGVICPILVLFLICSFFERYREFGQKVYTFQMIVLGYLHIGLISFLSPSDPGFNSYYGGLILIIGGLGVLGGLQIKYSVTTSILIVIGYQLMAIYIQNLLDTPLTIGVFVINTLFLITAVAISAFTSYLLESYSRKDFVQTIELNKALCALKDSQNVLKSTLKQQVEWSKLFTSFIRHELSNSIIGVSTSLQLIKKKSSDETAAFYTVRAEKSLKDLKKLLNKASEATCIDDALSISDLKLVNVNSLLEELICQYNEEYVGGVIFKSMHSIDIRGSRMLLNQLFRNLIDNAIRHSIKDKAVKVIIQAERTVVVENEGDPLLGENLDLLFDLGQSDDSVKSGLFGLGLYVVKKVVAAHGGTVLAEPLDGASGARFKVIFP
jgi:signal transduction histidine kinase